MTSLRKHAFITLRGLEYRELGQWKIEEFDPWGDRAFALNSDGLFARLWSANRAVWILDEGMAEKVREWLLRPASRFHVVRNQFRDLSDLGEDENFDLIEASERVSFKPFGITDQTKDCQLFFPLKAEAWGFSGEDDPQVIERALDSLQAEFGRSLVYPPGRLAIYLMEGCRDRAKEQVDYKRLPRFSNLPVEETWSGGNPFYQLDDLDWKRLRPLSDREGQMKYIHAFDKNAAFLQCVGIPLGIGHYRYVRRPPVTNDVGVWRVRSLPYFSPHWVEGRRHPGVEGMAEGFNPPGFTGSVPFSQWVTTPTLKLLCDLDLIVDVEEAWVADDSHKLFPTYYSRIKQAIDMCNRPFADAVDEQAQRLMKRLIKSIYVKGVGYLRADFARQSGEWFYRPDWWATIVSEATARIFRDAIEVYKAHNAWPIATYIDCLYYVSDNPDPWQAFPIFKDRFASKFKHKGTAPLTPDMIRAVEDGLTPGDFAGLFKRAERAYEEGMI